LEYFNSNADGDDRSQDDAISKFCNRYTLCFMPCLAPTKSWIVLSLEGRTFPVQTAYLETPSPNYVEAAVQAVFDIHMKEPKGDILVFLTGREEIEECCQEIADRSLT
jgi:ATP-dependent RNA helicase DDX35